MTWKRKHTAIDLYYYSRIQFEKYLVLTMWTTTLRLYLSEKRETEKRQSAAEEQNQIDFDSPLTHQKNEKKKTILIVRKSSCEYDGFLVITIS